MGNLRADFVNALLVAVTDHGNQQAVGHIDGDADVKVLLYEKGRGVGAE
jgi:hypothetical protein